MRLSVVIPAHNEAAAIGATVRDIARELEREHIDFEVIVIDDASTDGTGDLVENIGRDEPRIRAVRSHNPPGFGFAVRAGLDVYTGDAVAIMMADESDAPGDLVRYFRLLEEGFDCAFGSRFIRGSKVTDYPRAKLIANRLVNLGIRMLFRHGYNDTTNAFKAYRREVIESVRPLLSNHFNLTLEIPLKAIVRGSSYAIVPISWTNRRHGVSKLRLQEMGSRYLFIAIYVLCEHWLSRGDYRRDGEPSLGRRRLKPSAVDAQAGGRIAGPRTRA